MLTVVLLGDDDDDGDEDDTRACEVEGFRPGFYRVPCASAVRTPRLDKQRSPLLPQITPVWDTGVLSHRPHAQFGSSPGGCQSPPVVISGGC